MSTGWLETAFVSNPSDEVEHSVGASVRVLAALSNEGRRIAASLMQFTGLVRLDAIAGLVSVWKRWAIHTCLPGQSKRFHFKLVLRPVEHTKMNSIAAAMCHVLDRCARVGGCTIE